MIDRLPCQPLLGAILTDTIALYCECCERGVSRPLTNQYTTSTGVSLGMYMLGNSTCTCTTVHYYNLATTRRGKILFNN